MDSNSFVSLVIIISLVFGIIIGIVSFKIYNSKVDKKILKNAKEVLNNKRKNVINIEGKEYEATKFIVRDENDVEKIIDLKGGNIIQNEENKKSFEHKIKNNTNHGEDSGSVRKDGRSRREKKRNIKSIGRRARRFS